MLRRTGYYVRKILDGADPSNLPIEQPTGLELIVNLQTARILQIEVPATLLARASSDRIAASGRLLVSKRKARLEGRAIASIAYEYLLSE
jgi:hypothetical protein